MAMHNNDQDQLLSTNDMAETGDYHVCSNFNVVADELFMDCDAIINGNINMEKRNNACSLQPNGEEHWHASKPIAPQVINIDQQQQQLGAEKSKCRGNRKLQRHRRRLRAKGFDQATVTNLQQIAVTGQNDVPENQAEIKISTTKLNQELPSIHNGEYKITTAPSKKRKRNSATRKTIAAINTSFSQLSISQSLVKKQKKSREHSPNNTISNKKNKRKLSMKESYQELPRYLKVLDSAFKQMLSTAVEGTDKVVQYLNTTEKITFIRQYAYLIHRLLYIQLQQEQWNYYYQLGMTENIWYGRVTRKWAKQNSICHTYGQPPTLIEQRQNKITQQLLQAESVSKEFEAQSLPKWISENNLPFDVRAISSVVTALVRKGQYKLRRQFEHSRQMLILNSRDHRLLQAFYDFMPSEQQIRSAKLLWKHTQTRNEICEHIEILKHRLHSNNLPSTYNLLDHSIDSIERMLASVQSTVLDKSARAMLSSRGRKKIGQFKYDMLTLTVATAEEILRTIHKAIEEEKKLFLTAGNNNQSNSTLPPLQASLTNLMEAIETRQAHMTQRAQYVTKQKLHSFFDEAPAMFTDLKNNSAVVGANY